MSPGHGGGLEVHAAVHAGARGLGEGRGVGHPARLGNRSQGATWISHLDLFLGY